MALLLPALGFFVWGAAPSCMGFEDPTLEALAACPAATEALGAPITRSWAGISCGNAETDGAFGRANWSFPVSGPRGSGSVDVVAEQRAGPWQLLRVTLEVGGRSIAVVPCAGSAGSGAIQGGAPR